MVNIHSMRAFSALRQHSHRAISATVCAVADIAAEPSRWLPKFRAIAAATELAGLVGLEPARPSRRHATPQGRRSGNVAGSALISWGRPLMLNAQTLRLLACEAGTQSRRRSDVGRRMSIAGRARQRCRKCLDLLGAATYAERANAATASMRSGDTESATERRRTSDVDRGPSSATLPEVP